MRKILAMALAASVSCAALLSSPATAAYPEKPVSFVIPFPPGDLEDVLTRLIADKFQEKYNVSAGVINKPGGGGGPFPGAVEVAKAPADGYTVGSFIIAIPTIGPNIGIPELAPNPFEPIGNFLTYPFVIAVSKDAPYDDVAGLAKHSQTNDVVLGHFGGPLIPTKVTKALANKQGIKFASDAAFDALDCNTLASGDVDVMNTTLQLILPCMDKVKVLASIGAERIAITPDVPTVAELVPELKLALWNGLFVHKDTPQDARDKLAEVAKEVMESDAAKKIAKDTGALIYWQDAEAAQKQIESDIEALAVMSKILE